MKTCTVETCNTKSYCKQLCQRHYTRLRKGQPLVKILDRSNWTECNIAWLAGIIEGEGTFTLRGKDKHTTIKIVSTDFDVIDKIQAVIGTGRINGPYKRSDNRKYFKVWSLHESYPQKELMLAILPWMCKRRAIRIRQCLRVLTTALKNSKNPYQ